MTLSRNHLINNKACKKQRPSSISSRLNVLVRTPTPFGLCRNGCWSFRKFHLPWVLPLTQSIFSPRFSLNVSRRTARSLFEIGRLFSLFSCLFLACVLIFLLLLMKATFILTLAPSFRVQCAQEI